MLRLLLTIALPLLLPSVLYFGWVWATHGGQVGEGWLSAPWLWLAAAGVLGLGLLLLVVTVRYGTTQPGSYVPSRWENGHVVPGRFAPTPSQPKARP